MTRPAASARSSATGRRAPRTATIYAVAERAGVSIATVSRVLHGTGATSADARERVLAAVASLDYVPQTAARSLVSRRYDAHGLVLGAMTGPYWTDLLVGYEEQASATGDSLVVMSVVPDQDPSIGLRRLAARVDGIVIADHSMPAAAAAALAETVPVVTVSRDPVPGCVAVGTESVASATELTAHLIAHGRRALVFVGDPDGSADVRDRYAGFRAAHLAAGLPVPTDVARVPQTEQSGYDTVARLLGPGGSRPTFDGLVCANDELALAVVKALQAAGVDVPAEVAVTGWDDIHAARYLDPGLTTVRQQTTELGALAARLLQERIAGAAEIPAPHVLPTDVVLRGSCGCRPPPWHPPRERPSDDHRRPTTTE